MAEVGLPVLGLLPQSLIHVSTLQHCRWAWFKTVETFDFCHQLSCFSQCHQTALYHPCLNITTLSVSRILFGIVYSAWSTRKSNLAPHVRYVAFLHERSGHLAASFNKFIKWHFYQGSFETSSHLNSWNIWFLSSSILFFIISLDRIVVSLSNSYNPLFLLLLLLRHKKRTLTISREPSVVP